MKRAKKQPKTVPIERYKMIADCLHNQIVAMQAAWIEWQHGKGAEEGMRWIHNTLCGPGLIPKPGEPYSTEAQAWASANISEDQRLPFCQCGRPSHIGWMGRGFCSEEHYAEGRKQALN